LWTGRQAMALVDSHRPFDRAGGNTPVPNRATLEARLADPAAMPEQPELHLRPDRLVEYKVVAGVTAAAQRHHVTKIGMVGNEQFQ
jgi:biopolymer transport protein ExbD